MNFTAERELLVEHGRKMVEHGLTRGSGGNLSIFLRDENLMLITPSGGDYHKVTSSDMVLMDLNGNVVSGDRKPSSEYSMHAILYRRRSDINAVVHCHSIYSATLATLGWEIPAAYYLIGVGGGENVRVANYATYGTEELAENALEAMENRLAVLLANHGLLTGARSLASAFDKAEEIELCAEIYYRAKAVGEPKIIGTEEVNRMLDRFKSYGQRST